MSMKVIISDLHFEDSDDSKNIDPEVCESFMQQLEYTSWRLGVKSVDLFLAGDIFDISRSENWLRFDSNPYSNGDLSKITYLIMLSIVEKERVKKSLEIIRKYAINFRVPLNIHYIPGNHDRLINEYNATKARKLVREVLGLKIDSSVFPKAILTDDILIRHGHEYDKYNFGTDLSKGDIPIYPEGYDEPTVGDVITMELAVRLPYEFGIEHYKKIERNEVPKYILDRIKNIDDVRPRSAILPYLLGEEEETWEYVQPVLSKIAVRLRNDNYFWDIINKPVISRTMRTAIRSALWMLSSNWIARRMRWAIVNSIRVFSSVPQSRRIDSESFASREKSVTKYVVHGHSHDPNVGVFDKERYWLDSGTWRSTIHSTKDGKHFGKSKSWTYVLLTDRGFDFWTGYSEHGEEPTHI